MDDKKLNIDQPIPSVRRLLYFKKDQHTGKDKCTPSKVKRNPICNRARVPFTWEESPGRPKPMNPPKNHDNIIQSEPALQEEIAKIRKHDSDKELTSCARAGDGYLMDGGDLKIDQLTLDHTMDWVLPGDHEFDNDKRIYQDIVPYFRQNVIEQESEDMCQKSPVVKMCGIFRFSNPAPGRNKQSQVYLKQHISSDGDKNGDSGKVGEQSLYVDAPRYMAKTRFRQKEFMNLERSERIKESPHGVDTDPYSYVQVVDEWDGEMESRNKKVEHGMSFEFAVPPGLQKSATPTDPLTLSVPFDSLPVCSKTTVGDVEMKVKGETRKANSLLLEERGAPICKTTKKTPGSRSNKACNAYGFGLRFN